MLFLDVNPHLVWQEMKAVHAMTAMSSSNTTLMKKIPVLHVLELMTNG